MVVHRPQDGGIKLIVNSKVEVRKLGKKPVSGLSLIVL